MKRVLDLIQVLDNLSRIPRTGGVLFAGIDPNRGDSIAEHSYKVTYLSLFFGEIARKNGHEINLEKLLKTAIIHDWTDTILLDIPSGSPSYKSYFGDGDELKTTVKNAESKARGTMEEYVKEVFEMNLDQDLTETEKAIVLSADIIALLIEVLEWKYQGLKYEWLDYMWSNTLGKLSSEMEGKIDFLLPIVDELDNAYKTGVKPPNPFLTKPQFQTLKK